MKRLHYDSCTSTNDMLKKEHGDLLAAVAEEQTAGRGQRGNSWYSEAGRNLLFSVLAEPQGVLASEAFILSQAMALAIARTLEKHLPQKGVRIKWPNDIYVAGRKVCGILIENDLQGKCLVRSIIGCGINVNQTRFPDGLAVPATSLALETGREEDREQVLDEGPFTAAFATGNMRTSAGTTTSASICAARSAASRMQRVCLKAASPMWSTTDI